MTPEDDDRLWRNRFIAINLVRIGGTIVVLLGLYISQTDAIRRGRRDRSSACRLRWSASSISFGGAALAGAADGGRRPSHEALLQGSGCRPGRRRAASRSCSTGGRSGLRRARPLELADRRRWPKRRRGMERAGRQDRSAVDAADRPRQCRDRPGRAGPGRLRPPASPSTARATCSAIAPSSPSRWSRGRPRPGTRCSTGRAGASTSSSRSSHGLIHRPQPEATLDRLRRAVAARDPLRARRSVAAGHDLGLAGDRAGAGRGRRSTWTRPGRRRRSTKPGRPSNGARTRSPPPRSRRGGASSKPPSAFSACSQRLAADRLGRFAGRRAACRDMVRAARTSAPRPARRAIRDVVSAMKA